MADGQLSAKGSKGCIRGWIEKAAPTWIVAIGLAVFENGHCADGTSGGPDALKMHAITMAIILKFRKCIAIEIDEIRNVGG